MGLERFFCDRLGGVFFDAPDLNGSAPVVFDKQPVASTHRNRMQTWGASPVTSGHENSLAGVPDSLRVWCGAFGCQARVSQPNPLCKPVELNSGQLHDGSTAGKQVCCDNQETFCLSGDSKRIRNPVVERLPTGEACE